MAILIDPPQWPAHGTLWSHLVSDHSYDELHAFAAHMPLPRRGFDLDHYDVPASLFTRAVDLGAIAVDARDIVYRLRDSGLRVRQIDRTAARATHRRQYLLAEWAALGVTAGVAGRSTRETEAWQNLGDNLIARWNEPHRRYHDEQHLEDVLLSLNHLETQGEKISADTVLAAWFHDAIYQGTVTDEADSADFAVAALSEFALAPARVQEIGELVLATMPSRAQSEAPEAQAHLLDADLAIFGASEARYGRYTAAVRDEYAHVPEPQFRSGRAQILRGYLDLPTIYRTGAARELWEQRARVNLQAEITELLAEQE